MGDSESSSDTKDNLIMILLVNLLSNNCKKKYHQLAFIYLKLIAKTRYINFIYPKKRYVNFPDLNTTSGLTKHYSISTCNFLQPFESFKVENCPLLPSSFFLFLANCSYHYHHILLPHDNNYTMD